MTTLSRLLKESWSLIEDRADAVASYFYARLFTRHPHLRDLFPLQMTSPRERLVKALAWLVQNMEDPARVEEYARGLGRTHRRFQVLPEHYPLVRAALLDALRAYAGESWTREYELAWRQMFDIITQHMIGGAEADAAAGHPPFWDAEVVSHQRRTADIAVFRCRPFQPFFYRAGQYTYLESAYRPRLWRPYSIANVPGPDNELEFHVRAVGAGWCSSALVWKLKPGDVVRLGPAQGTMTLDRQSPRDVVCVAGGTGLAPIKAIIEELASFQHNRRVTVFVGVRRRVDLYDIATLRRWEQQLPWLRLVVGVSDEPVNEHTAAGESLGESGAAGPSLVRGAIPDLLARYGSWNADVDVFVSGPPGMVRATVDQLTALQVPVSRIKYDPFDDV